MMAGIPSLFGDGAALGFGGGPIRSQDQNISSFNTGPVNFGSSTSQQIMTIVIVLALIGVLLWLVSNSKG